MYCWKKIILGILIAAHSFSNAQQIDLEKKNDTVVTQNSLSKIKFKQLIIPTVLLSYGIIGLESDQLKLFNSEIKEEVDEHIDKRLTIDDIAQYSPAVTALGLDAIGIKGKNKFKDKAIILSTSYIIMGLTVETLKHTTNEQRPDGKPIIILFHPVILLQHLWEPNCCTKNTKTFLCGTEYQDI